MGQVIPASTVSCGSDGRVILAGKVIVSLEGVREE